MTKNSVTIRLRHSSFVLFVIRASASSFPRSRSLFGFFIRASFIIRASEFSLRACARHFLRSYPCDFPGDKSRCRETFTQRSDLMFANEFRQWVSRHLKSLQRGNSRERRRKSDFSRRSRPRLEALEDRCVPTASFTVNT